MIDFKNMLRKGIVFVLVGASVLVFTGFTRPVSQSHQVGQAKKEHTLTLSYSATGCSCAKWSETRFENQLEKREYIYLERGAAELVDVNNLWNGENLPLKVEVTGTFISNSGYPTGFEAGKEKPEPARVFRYSKIKVIQNGQ